MNTELIEQINNAIFYHDKREAKSVLAMAAKNPEIGISEQDKNKLYFVVMNSLNSDKVLNLIKKSILTAYNIPDYNLEDKIVDYVELLDDPPLQIDFILNLEKILEQHEEILGENKIVVNGQKKSATVSNWISDYIYSHATQDGDVLSEMKYLNTSPNTKGLDVEKRSILKSILKLYDRIAQYSELWDILPDKLSDDQIKEFENYYQHELEKIEREDLAQSQHSEQIKTEADFTRQTDLSTDGITLTKIEPRIELEQGKPQQADSESKLEYTKSVSPNSIIAKKPPVGSVKPEGKPFHLGQNVNQGQQQKRGVVYDQDTNVDLAEIENRAKQQQKQRDIAAKLEELKKRKQGDK